MEAVAGWFLTISFIGVAAAVVTAITDATGKFKGVSIALGVLLLAIAAETYVYRYSLILAAKEPDYRSGLRRRSCHSAGTLVCHGGTGRRRPDRVFQCAVRACPQFHCGIGSAAGDLRGGRSVDSRLCLHIRRSSQRIRQRDALHQEQHRIHAQGFRPGSCGGDSL